MYMCMVTKSHLLINKEKLHANSIGITGWMQTTLKIHNLTLHIKLNDS